MLNIVIHYPCSYPLHINERVVCGEWPQKLKREIINGINGINKPDISLEGGKLINKENVFVIVLPVIEDITRNGMTSDLKAPVLVTVYVGSGKRQNIASLGYEFNAVLIKSLRSTFGNERFTVNIIYADSSFSSPSF